MVGSLFRSLRLKRDAPRVGRRRPVVPRGFRIYAIGDLHGRADLLVQLGALIEEDVAKRGPVARTVLVFLGDYVDRGPYSRDVIDLLIAGAPDGYETVFLKGNHEAMLLKFLADPAFGLTWRDYGGVQTLHSYGVAQTTLAQDAMAFGNASRALMEALPPAHLEFLLDLELSVSFGDYLFTHAGIRPGLPIAKQRESDLLWIRAPFLSSNTDYGCVVVHGHTPGEKPVVKRNRICIDTNACESGVLTALGLEGHEYWFLQTGPEPANGAAS